jgi:HD-GYP domain-containing protein (c-di-GMP phosphodiesterase class II)
LEQQIEDLRTSLICAFNQLLDLKDVTGVDSTWLAEWSVRVAQESGVDDAVLREVEVAALLHDIGKVGIPDAILRKPGRLGDAEYGLMKKTPSMDGPCCACFPAWNARASLSCITTRASTGRAARLA